MDELRRLIEEEYPYKMSDEVETVLEYPVPAAEFIFDYTGGYTAIP